MKDASWMSVKEARNGARELTRSLEEIRLAPLGQYSEWRDVQLAKSNLSFYFWNTPLEELDMERVLEGVAMLAGQRRAFLDRMNPTPGGDHAQHGTDEAGGSGVDGDAAASGGDAEQAAGASGDDAAGAAVDGARFPLSDGGGVGGGVR